MSTLAETVLLDLLRHAELEPVGRIASASNVTLLCRLGGDPPGRELLAVYKPERGEAPLWDFPPDTLHRREVAAYVVDRALGWGMVPPTVRRDDGPYGRGSVQLFVDHDPDRHYFALVEEGDPDVLSQLRRMVVFDLVVNNADRKGSHVLLSEDGRIHLVDHGICFHHEPKLRTVAWDFADEPVPEDARDDVARLAGLLSDAAHPVTRRLGDLLDDAEIAALARRARQAGELDRLPRPSGPRPLPWPPL